MYTWSLVYDKKMTTVYIYRKLTLMIKLVALIFFTRKWFQEIRTELRLKFTVQVPLSCPRIFRINAVVLGSNYSISIFN